MSELTSLKLNKINLFTNEKFNTPTPFQKTFIIRGIGYKASLVDLNNLTLSPLVKNNKHFSSNVFDSCWVHDSAALHSHLLPEFPYSRYLVIRAGHSFSHCIPIPNYLGFKITKKERKLVIYSYNNNLLSIFSKRIFLMRPPSVYTGRGIRRKGIPVRRKLGKKDVRKGRYY